MMNGHSQSDFFPSGYGVPASGPMPHNPNSNPQRPGYATTAGLPSALQNGRRSQPSGPDMNNHSHNQQNGTPSLYSDDRFASFEPNNRFDRTSSAQSNLSAAYGVFGTNAPQQSTWGGYNGAGSAATMGGPMNDGSRIRPNNRRPPIHAEWTASNDQLGTPNGGHPNGGHMPFFPPLLMGGQQQMGMPSGMPSGIPSGMPSGIPPAASPDPFNVPPSVNVQNYGQPDMRNMSDNRKDMGDLIPTAIVIKNIPFNVRKEVLTNIMVELHLPQPYAFNYHFDNGVFRGLAFANFQSPADTKHVIESMNGLDIHGRKLRVEYKKMLPEHERERIEREKREKRGQLEEQHRGPAHQISISSMSAANNASRAPAPPQPVPVNANVNDRNSFTQRPDMNDPATLRYYVQLWMFIREDDREVIIFPSDISPEDRRVVHILAHNMGLEHTSIGEGDNRQIHVSKVKFNNGGAHPSQQLGVTVDGHPRGLSRAATFDFNDRQHHTHLNTINTRSQNLTIPSSSPDTQQHGMNGLRGVKSFADLRSVSPSPSLSHVSNSGGPSSSHQANGIHAGSAGGFMSHFPSPADSNAFGHSLTAHNSGSSVNLGSNMPSNMSTNMSSLDTSSISAAFSSLGLGSSPFDTSSSPALGSGRVAGAPVPGAIGSQRPSANGNGNGNGANGSRANPERQPRGPGGDWEGGFSRARSNGHMHRSSDSSDNMNSNASANSAGRNGNLY